MCPLNVMPLSSPENQARPESGSKFAALIFLPPADPNCDHATIAGKPTSEPRGRASPRHGFWLFFANVRSACPADSTADWINYAVQSRLGDPRLRKFFSLLRAPFSSLNELSPRPNPKPTNDLRRDFASGQKFLLKSATRTYTNDHTMSWRKITYDLHLTTYASPLRSLTI